MAIMSVVVHQFARDDVTQRLPFIGRYRWSSLLLWRLTWLLLVTNWSFSSPATAILSRSPSIEQQLQSVSSTSASDAVTPASRSTTVSGDRQRRSESTPPRPGPTIPSPWSSAMGSNGDCHFLVGFLPALSANKGQNKHFVGAFEYALKRINERLAEGDEALSRCRISYETADNKADTAESLRRLTQMYIRGAVAFIGPEDTCATEARLASAWNLPMIAFKCRDSAISVKPHLYPTFARTIPSTSKVSKSVISLMKYFGWTHFQAIVGRPSANWNEAAVTLTELAKVNGIEMNNYEYFPEPYIGKNEMPDIVEKTYRNTRIYVFLGDPHALIDFVRSLAERNLNNGEYVVIAVQDETFDPKNSQKYVMKYVEPEFEEGMLSAFNCVLMLLPRPPSNPRYDEFLSESREYSYLKPFYAPTPPIAMKIPVPIYASYLHDAVSVYARAMIEVLQENVTNIRNGTAILSKIKGRMYESIQGHVMYIDENGDAEANYTVVALVTSDEVEVSDEETTSGYEYITGEYGKKLQSVAHFVKHGDGLPIFSYDHTIEWVGGHPPRSEPECGFDGSKCRFHFEWPVALACIVAASVVITAVIFICRHYIYEQKLARMLWKIDYKDLLMADPEHEPSILLMADPEHEPSILLMADPEHEPSILLMADPEHEPSILLMADPEHEPSMSDKMVQSDFTN